MDSVDSAVSPKKVKSSTVEISDYESILSRPGTPLVVYTSTESNCNVNENSSVEVKERGRRRLEGQEDADLFNVSVDTDEIDDKSGVRVAIISGSRSEDVKN